MVIQWYNGVFFTIYILSYHRGGTLSHSNWKQDDVTSRLHDDLQCYFCQHCDFLYFHIAIAVGLVSVKGNLPNWSLWNIEFIIIESILDVNDQLNRYLRYTHWKYCLFEDITNKINVHSVLISYYISTCFVSKIKSQMKLCTNMLVIHNSANLQIIALSKNEVSIRCIASDHVDM